jgi:hypothetical protein
MGEETKREIWFRCHHYGGISYGNAYLVHWKGYAFTGITLSLCVLWAVFGSQFGNLWVCVGFAIGAIPIYAVMRRHLEIVRMWRC